MTFSVIQNKRALLLFPILTLILFVFTYTGSDYQAAQSSNRKEIIDKQRKEQEEKEFREAQSRWANGILNSLSLEQKVGQLFMIPTYSNRTEKNYQIIRNKIRKYHVGGLIFFQGTPKKQAELTNEYQQISDVPLLIGMDAEWGLAMRLDNAFSFPKQITMGAVQNERTIQMMGEQVGKHCKRLGVHINFAPVADVNTNPKNPVINYRSFGENPNRVALLTAAYARGMQSENVMACAKHFPGHGDTGSDSHHTLPTLNHSRERLDNNELIPFKVLIADSVAAVMTGHLSVPAVDPKAGPGTTSKKMVTDLLQTELGFQGLTVTDAMNMKGVSSRYSSGGAELAAYEAGNDLILQSVSLDAAFNKILSAHKSGKLSIQELDRRVLKILKAKYWVGLNKEQTIETYNLEKDLNDEHSQKVKETIFKEAITVLRAERGLLPFIQLDTLSVGTLEVNGKPSNDFYEEIAKHGKAVNYEMHFKPSTSKDWAYITNQASTFDVMVVAIRDINSVSRRNYGVTPTTIQMLRSIAKKTKLVVVGMGSPYSMRLFDEFENVICAYESDPAAYKAVAELIYGVNKSKGKLPVTASPLAAEGMGLQTKSLARLTEAEPYEVGVDINRLREIDDIVAEGIAARAFPGAQILVARRGKVIYHKSYGHLTYDKTQKVTNHTLYDLASLTKVTATLQAVMMLNERGELDLNRRASYYIPELRGTHLKDLVIGDILFHQAGLKSFQAFWTRTKNENKAFKGEFYSFNAPEGKLQVADGMYITPSIKDSVLQWIIDTPFTTRRNRNGSFKYLYSDLGMILTQMVVESIVNQPLDEFLDQNLYEPLGMSSTLFNPLQKFSKNDIAPTEYDRFFRNKQIWGTVHDPNAALLGGVAGHAGLFSNSWDLAKLLQMNLQKGVYGGRQYMFPNTIEHFGTNYTKKSHRGIGWNKPLEGTDLSSVASNASSSTYGHTGFTGTVAWVDPERQLIFIMLANRVYPHSNNRQLMKLDIRKRIHEKINAAIDYY